MSARVGRRCTSLPAMSRPSLRFERGRLGALEVQAMPLSMPGRTPPAHERVPAGWLSDGDATARAGRLMMGDERTGAEARALSDQEIPALLDDRRELAWAYRRWRKTIREEEGARRAQSATAPHDAIPEEEQARRARALAAATPRSGAGRRHAADRANTCLRPASATLREDDGGAPAGAPTAAAVGPRLSGARADRGQRPSSRQMGRSATAARN